ncbi:DUF6624 domain-containing protein [Streptomyces sp. NPDC004533]|uniref:DUF6624 domain-containing protein n=1 Tax=Streptomyces sp. NPDC004533 TaxID=3154278 RepID=UPI0033B7C894
MTTPDQHQPQRHDLAQTLIQRAEAASENRRAARSTAATQQGPTGAGAALLTDQANTQVLERIVAAHGWPGRSLVGEEAARAALTLALNADQDPRAQNGFLRAVHEAARQGEVSASQWARLYDRCLARDGKLQVYGTQHRRRPDGELELYPVQGRDQLDVRRAQVGLLPHAEQFRLLRKRLAGGGGSLPVPVPEHDEDLALAGSNP